MKWLNPLLLTFPLLVIGCRSDHAYQEVPRIIEGDKVLINGRVKGSARQAPVTLQVLSNNNQQVLHPDTLGRFLDTLKVSRPSFMQLVHQDQSGYGFIKPGDSLSLTFKSSDLPATLRFKGNRSHTNNYLAAKQLYKDSIEPRGRKAKTKWYSLEPTAFQASIDSLRTQYQAFYQDHFSQQPPSKAFHELEQANIRYHLYREKLKYPGNYRKLRTGRYPELPEGFKAYKQAVDFKQSRLFGVPSYQAFLRMVVNQNARPQIKANPSIARTMVVKRVVDSMIPNDTLKARVLGRFLLQSLKTNGPASIQGVMAYYRGLPHADPMMQRLRHYLDQWQNIAPSRQAPGFTYPVYKGDALSLSALRGSYVYIDAWATWCRPCIQQLPYLDTLRSTYDRDEVRFVSISLDKTKAQWQDFLQKRAPGGIQLLANQKGFNSGFAKDYVIHAIPRYILINPEGHIVDPTAPPPAGNIQLTLDSLLNAPANPQNSPQ